MLNKIKCWVLGHQPIEVDNSFDLSRATYSSSIEPNNETIELSEKGDRLTVGTGKKIHT